MATLTLTKVWVNLVSSGAAISAQSGEDRPQQWDSPGSVRSYAGGRQRFVGPRGESGTLTATLRSIDLATIVTLRGWKQQTVLVRDHRGQRWYGVFTGVQVNEWKGELLYDVTVSVNVVTVVEGV
jgi:hypothetical protein